MLNAFCLLEMSKNEDECIGHIGYLPNLRGWQETERVAGINIVRGPLPNHSIYLDLTT